MLENLLEILKQSSAGLTIEEFLAKAKEAGIAHPLNLFDQLVAQGKARKDEYPSPARYKATNLAWNKNI